MKRFLLIFVFSLFAATVFAAPIENSSQKEVELKSGSATGILTVTVSASEITVAESLTMTIAISQPAGTSTHLPSFGELGFATDFTERSQRFRVTNISEPSETPQPDGTLLLQQTYTLEPWLSGDYALLPIMISFYEASPSKSAAPKADSTPWPMPLFSLMTDGIRVRVSPLPADRRDLSDLLGQADLRSQNLMEKERRAENKSDEELKREEENKKEAAMALKERPFPWWIIWTVLVLLAAAPLIWFLGRKRIKEFLTKKTTPAHIKALADFDRLRQKDLLGQGLIKEFYYELSYILREYIGGRFQIFADRQTTEEFFQQLLITNPFDKMAEQILRDFSERADTVKYSLYKPEKKIAQESFQIAQSFVENTKPHQEEKS